MKKTIITTALLLVFVSSSAIAGFGSSSDYYPRSDSGNVVASVRVEGEGVFNLVVSLEFLNRPGNTKLYKSPSYQQLINHLSVKWQSIALDKILAASTVEMGGLSDLKMEIESAVDVLVANEITKQMGGKKVEVIYSITHIMLLEPRN